MSTFNIGDTVTFRPGPKAREDVTAKITAQGGGFLTTSDSGGFVRKVRPGAARLAA